MASYVHCKLYRPDLPSKMHRETYQGSLTPSAAAANATGAGNGEYDILLHFML